MMHFANNSKSGGLAVLRSRLNDFHFASMKDAVLYLC